MALNPLNLSKLDVKLKVKMIQDRLELLENDKSLLEANYRIIVQRQVLLEEAGSRREGDFEMVRQVFDYDTLEHVLSF